MDYLAESSRTLPPDTQFHGEIVPRQWFFTQLRAAIKSTQEMDKIKKAFFYGRDKNDELKSLHSFYHDGPDNKTVVCTDIPDRFANATNLVHAILGIYTEAGELLEALANALNQEPVDAVNLKEEVGDVFWYAAILARDYGFTFDESMSINIDKLRARFPDKFDAHLANNRNLDAERVILERPVGMNPALGMPYQNAATPIEEICEDEGCPHYGTPHGHDPSSVVGV